MSFPLKSCPVCGEEHHDQLYLARDRHYGIDGLYRFVRCMGCSLVFLDPMFSDQELSALYPTDYYSYQDNFQQKPWKEFIKQLLLCRVGTVEPNFSTPGKVLDLGCGSGWFLSAMLGQGWDAYGVEINNAAAELGRKTAGLNIFSGTLQQANFPPEFFDYVRSNHSFEHLSCPGETLDEIYRILRPGGKVLIGVPNVDGLNARVFRQYWWYLGAPVHPFGYSVRTLSKFLEKHRFYVQKVIYNSDFSGILGSFQILLNRKSGRRSSEGWLIRNPLLKVSCHWAARLIDSLHMGDAIEITAIKQRA